MTDFFTSLAARSFGAAAVIRPRLASLFEPIGEVGASSPGAVAPQPEQASHTPENGRGEGWQKTATQSRPVARDDDEQSAALGPDEGTGAASRIVPQFAPLTVGDVHQRTAPSAKELEPSPLVFPPTQLIWEPHQSGRETAAEGLATMAAPGPRVSDNGRNYGLVAETQPRFAVTVAQEQVSRDDRGLVIPPKIPAEMRLSDFALSRQPERQSRAGASDLSSPEPTVQVTIGRIEVRATPDGVRAPRPASPSRVMGLDEYLRGRSKRGGQ